MKEATIKSIRRLSEFVGNQDYASVHRRGTGELEIGLHFQTWEGLTGWNLARRAARMLWLVFRNRRGIWVGRQNAKKKPEAAA